MLSSNLQKLTATDLKVQQAAFEAWAIVEIMGHQTYAGRVSEQVVGGTSFVRVDIPDVDGQPGFTKLFGGDWIYCITPTTEPIARSMAQRYTQRPVQVYDLPEEWQRKIRAPRIERDADGFELETMDDDQDAT